MDNHNALEQAWLNGYKQGRQAVEKCGPIDVAVVVRCKDCVGKNYWYKTETGIDVCGLSGLYVVEDRDFCSYGERKTE